MSDPFQLILDDRLDDLSVGQDPLGEAIVEFSKDPLRIVPILVSTDPNVICNGLYILSEVGCLPPELIELALRHIRHEDWDARFYLANSVLVSYVNLTQPNLEVALALLEDESVDVRNKMIELLRLMAPSMLRLAVGASSVLRKKQDHLAGLGILEDEQVDNSELLKIIACQASVVRSYAGARLLLNAEARPVDVTFPADMNAELDYLRWRIGQIERRRKSKSERQSHLKSGGKN